MWCPIAYAAAVKADNEWGAELRRLFGKDAGDARYQKRGVGAEGSELRRLHDAREAARIVWEKTINHTPRQGERYE